MLHEAMQHNADELTKALLGALETWGHSEDEDDDDPTIVATDIVITAAAQFVAGFLARATGGRQMPQKALRALVERYETTLRETGYFNKA